jgi:hypothetical protein
MINIFNYKKHNHNTLLKGAGTSNTGSSLNKNGNIETGTSKKLKSGELNFQNTSLPFFSGTKKYLNTSFWGLTF